MAMTLRMNSPPYRLWKREIPIAPRCQRRQHSLLTAGEGSGKDRERWLSVPDLARHEQRAEHQPGEEATQVRVERDVATKRESDVEDQPEEPLAEHRVRRRAEHAPV